jgi:hypothetical protein
MGEARLSAAKPPRAAPGLAARGSTAVTPRHKGIPCPKPIPICSASEADRARAVREPPHCPVEPPPVRPPRRRPSPCHRPPHSLPSTAAHLSSVSPRRSPPSRAILASPSTPRELPCVAFPCAGEASDVFPFPAPRHTASRQRRAPAPRYHLLQRHWPDPRRFSPRCRTVAPSCPCERLGYALGPPCTLGREPAVRTGRCPGAVVGHMRCASHPRQSCAARPREDSAHCGMCFSFSYSE